MNLLSTVSARTLLTLENSTKVNFRIPKNDKLTIYKNNFSFVFPINLTKGFQMPFFSEISKTLYATVRKGSTTLFCKTSSVTNFHGRSISTLLSSRIAKDPHRNSLIFRQVLQFDQSRSFATQPQTESFDPPGGLDEFNTNQKSIWSDWVSGQFDQAIVGYPDRYTFDGPRSQFYNPSKEPLAPDGKAAKVSWIGFPRNIQVQNPNNEKRWKIADGLLNTKDKNGKEVTGRDVQDEYCEWNVVRNTALKITRVTFTCENPEYWDFLGRYNPDLLLQLYQKYVGNHVKREDLFSTQIQDEGVQLNLRDFNH
jgi:hypothetical protein